MWINVYVVDTCGIERRRSALDAVNDVPLIEEEARKLPPEACVVVGLCEGSDKDVRQIGRALGVPL